MVELQVLVAAALSAFPFIPVPDLVFHILGDWFSLGIRDVLSFGWGARARGVNPVIFNVM